MRRIVAPAAASVSSHKIGGEFVGMSDHVLVKDGKTADVYTSRDGKILYVNGRSLV